MPLTIASPTLTVGEVAIGYAPVTIQASGGNAPYIWRVIAGGLPGGMKVSPDGVISGTPTASGTFTFTVEVTDAGMATTKLSNSIRIVPRFAAHVIGNLATHREVPLLPDAVGTSEAFATFSGGLPPYTYEIVSSDYLPRGAHLIMGPVSSNTTGDGLRLADVPPDGATFSLTIRGADALGATATITAKFHEYWWTDTPPSWICGPGMVPVGNNFRDLTCVHPSPSPSPSPSP